MTIAIYIVLAILVALLVLDWTQTITIATNPEKWSEINVILGKHPTVRAVHLYFGTVVAIAAALSLLPAIPEVVRLVFVAMFAGLEGFVTWQNKKHGL